MIITSFEQFRYLSKNKGRDPKAVYKDWLFEEAKLLMLMDSMVMMFQMMDSAFIPPAGGSSPEPELYFPPPPLNVTYYAPSGMDGPLYLGYYTPDDSLAADQSYYVFA